MAPQLQLEFVDDPHAIMAKAAAAGGKEFDPVRDYDYEYRQGLIVDPFGHHWLLKKRSADVLFHKNGTELIIAKSCFIPAAGISCYCCIILC
jgi:hypothetical protein